MYELDIHDWPQSDIWIFGTHVVGMKHSVPRGSQHPWTLLALLVVQVYEDGQVNVSTCPCRSAYPHVLSPWARFKSSTIPTSGHFVGAGLQLSASGLINVGPGPGQGTAAANTRPGIRNVGIKTTRNMQKEYRNIIRDWMASPSAQEGSEISK